MSRLIRLLSILLVSGIILTSCAPTTTTTPTQAQEQTRAQLVTESEPNAPIPTGTKPLEPFSTPQPQKDDLVIAQSVDPQVLNPYTQVAAWLSVVANICEPLMMLDTDENGQVYFKHVLATDHRWLDDVTIQFDLREGVTFSNGEIFNADAVKTSLELLFTDEEYGPWLKDLLKEVIIIDPYKVNLVITKQSPILEFALAMGSYIIAPKDFQTRGLEAMRQAPIGTGPWVFKEHVIDSHITLVANPNYWGGTPKFKTVTFKIIPDDGARVAALEAGEVDIAAFVPLSAASRIKGNEDLTLASIPSLRQFAVFFDVDDPKAEPLKDVKVRLALNYAIDRVGMCEQLFEGRCTPMQGQFFSSNHIGFNPDLEMYPYDPQKAKELLAEAGYKDGFEVDYTYTVGRYPQDKQAGEAISSYLRAVGITVNERAVEYTEWMRSFMELDNTALYTVGFAFGWDSYFSLTSYLPGTRFRTSVMPSTFDEKVKVAGETPDQAERLRIIQDILVDLNKEPFAVYLYSLDDLYGLQNWIKDFQPRPDQVIRLTQIGVTPKQ